MTRLVRIPTLVFLIITSPAVLVALGTTETAEQDYNIRGVDTYTTHIVFPKGLTAEQAFEKLAQDYDFKIEWADDDSTEAAAVKTKIQDQTYHARGSVRTAVERSYSSLFDKQIVSPRLVRMSVKESAKAEARRKAEQSYGVKK